MNRLDNIVVYYDGQKAGYLERNSTSFSFRYASTYLVSKQSLPISCNLPLSEREYTSPALHSFFRGLEPQGWYKNALLSIDKIG
ncbi:MAG: HipA N-terminal domain-containing protein, partial [Lentisphaeraceae bacterium]|nr:HipA N-terminal domain-containing protein [Lentisphaeraceae bacterium]